MKRSYFYLAACALALTACTSESVLEDQVRDSREISFQNVVKKLTRQGDVTDLTGNSLKTFQVYGYYTTPENSSVANQIFSNVEVTCDDQGNWSYTDNSAKRYWVPGAKYYFYAYSCGTASDIPSGMGSWAMNMADNRTPQQRVLTLTGYICDETNQHDLIFASNTGATEADKYAGIIGKEKDNDAVAFQFSHLLSKVNAKFTSDFPDEYTVEISDVKITNIKDRGNYDPVKGWNNVYQKNGGNHRVFLLDTNDDEVSALSTTATGGAVTTNSAYVIPAKYVGEKSTDEWSGETTNTYAILEFTLTLKYKDEVILNNKTIVGEFEPDWKTGNTYTYNITVDGDAAGLEIISFTTEKDGDGNIVSNWSDNTIKFVPTVNEWEEGGGGTIIVP